MLITNVSSGASPSTNRAGTKGPNIHPEEEFAGSAANVEHVTGACKRRIGRRVNNAERRATHNAVERIRRETLNGRFLILASLLPPLTLANFRRPSKASIVKSTIATLNATRRHRILAAELLHGLAAEAEELRKEVNQWRARTLIPMLNVPLRSDGYHAVLRAGRYHFALTLEEGPQPEESEQDDVDGEDVNSDEETETTEAALPLASSPQHEVPPTQPCFTRSPNAVYPTGLQPYPKQAHDGCLSVSPPLLSTQISPSSSGWDGPVTPAPMPSRPDVGMVELLLPEAMMKEYDGRTYSESLGLHSAGAAYDLGSTFNNEDIGNGMGVGAMNGIGGDMHWAVGNPFHTPRAQQQAIAQVREVYERQQYVLRMSAAMAMGMPVSLNMGVMPVDIGVLLDAGMQLAGTGGRVFGGAHNQ
ncbi:hypothetical protein B0H19DRAFT_1065687 [Mycena capillaripes]|nr:hypothetical protein B0H19DRAFT_1065687 [Mycena capillaripes]